MTSAGIALINNPDPDNKTYEWANSVLTSARMFWRPLKNVTQERANRSVMYSMQPMDRVIASFDDEDFKKIVDFSPIPVFEPLVNSVVEDMVKNPPRAEVRAQDPTAINDKKEDLERLKNRYILERDRTEMQQRVFGPQSTYKVPYENYKGNVEEFDKLGLDEKDPDDVNFYEQNYQRLRYETAGQLLINNVLKTNQFDQSTMRRLVKDVFWAKSVCTQAYVDQITGEIKYRYIDPVTCWGIWGASNDGKDDIMRGWMDSVTVQEFLSTVGNDFDWAKSWRNLLWGINFGNNVKYTGFIRGGVTYDCFGNTEWQERIGCAGVESSSLLDFSMAYQFKVMIGYAEWRVMEATSTKLLNKKDPSFVEYVPYSYLMKKKQMKDGYEKVNNYQQQWYSCYFLATSSLTQDVYKFQKVYFQNIHGANDEYSNGTLCYYQEEGKSAVEIGKPYLQLVNFAYYRMLWIIYKSKPDADEFVWEELTQLAATVKQDFSQIGTNNQTPKIGTVITDLIKQMRAKHVRIRTYPRVDGKAVPQIYPIEKNGSGGLDPLAIAMQAITTWAETQIAAKIGINPMRIGANPPSRESADSEQRTINASYATTGYMYRMIQYLKEHLAIVTLNYASDIVKYKDTLPYKWIKTILGNEAFDDLQALDDFAAHRMGIYIEDYNYEFDKQRMLQAADIALQKGTLNIAQWGVICQTQNPKLGFKILAHLEIKTKKKERRQAVQDQQRLLQIEQQKHQMKMEEMSFDRETVWGTADREGMALVESAKIQAQAKVEVKGMQNEAETPKQILRTQGEKEIIQEKANVDSQKPLPS